VESSYWNRTLSRRIGRRKTLKIGGATAAAAAFLAACGGDDDDGGGSTSGGSSGGGGSSATPGSGSGGGSDLLTQSEYIPPENATRGGQLVDFMNAEPRSLDPVNPQANLNNIIAETMQTLVTEMPGRQELSRYQITGAFSDSWEVTPDQITFKIRPGTKWHNIEPVNGRAADSEDVLFSFAHHQELAPLSPLVWQATSGGGFAGTPSAPDATTVVVPLTDPLVYAINWFSAFGSYTGQIMMYPKEAESEYDPRNSIIGTGPFYVSQHEPSVDFTITRFEDYWDPDFALLDSIHMPILPEYAARQTQLRAGALHFGRAGNDIVRLEDLLIIKNDVPDLQLYVGSPAFPASVMTFGTQGDDVPYFDERVRRAISMAFDRDLDIEVRGNVKELQDAGLPVETWWNSHLGARDAYRGGGWWIDPRDTATFGENAKYFEYNLDEAKKLLAAAGYEDGFTVKFGYPNAAQFDRGNIVEPYFFYLQQLGLTVEDNGYEDYTQGYIPLDRDASGAFEGMGYHSVTGTIPSVISPISALVAEHLPASGVTFHGYSEGGGTGKTGDPTVIGMLEKAKYETDIEARKELAHDIQRHLAGKMWNLLEPGGSSGFFLSWPAVKNQGVYFSAAANWEKYQMWLDQSLPPFA